jgi:hypothetical protein
VRGKIVGTAGRVHAIGRKDRWQSENRGQKRQRVMHSGDIDGGCVGGKGKTEGRKRREASEVWSERTRSRKREAQSEPECESVRYGAGRTGSFWWTMGLRRRKPEPSEAGVRACVQKQQPQPQLQEPGAVDSGAICLPRLA